ncbi:hypothetical protein [Clostridium folliculivorans]|uniref:Uncharacterized protein n=1 Tax=Clostridium folliculivorans TaxID=2886038 RepID=A0A9W5Y1T2_9CLOT|nr:hypothetical protein [Clostridium folliculivorans]GKU24937.1 hypothetical protein CFOLD11_17630 [Clostridium folliculivorans]GKU31035.1 hypothetical protein CFB3_31420 [Clostridium folliculivorans]
MENNVSVRRAGNDKLDLALIQKEKSASLIIILAYIILINSAIKEREIILKRQRGINTSNDLEPTQLVVLSSSLTLIGNILLGDIAYTRLRELEKSIRSGESNFSITPNLNITTGYTLSILGSIFKTVGVIQRSNEQAQMTIL